MALADKIADSVEEFIEYLVTTKAKELGDEEDITIREGIIKYGGQNLIDKIINKYKSKSSASIPEDIEGLVKRVFELCVSSFEGIVLLYICNPYVGVYIHNSIS